MTQPQIPQGWTHQKLPVGLSNSYEFDSYTETRQFLDELAQLSEQTGFHPSLNFSRTQVTVRIEAEEVELRQVELDFATAADTILAQQAA